LKIVFSLLLIFLIQCAHFENDFTYRQCKNVVKYKICDPFAFNDSVVVKSFDYWNGLMGKDFFVYDGMISLSNYEQDVKDNLNDYIFVFLDTKQEKYLKQCGVTFYDYDSRGCLSNLRIDIKSQCIIESGLSFESIMRHEIGHTLGYRNSYSNDNNLMHYAIDKDVDGPKKISEKELEILKKKYR
jgi:hypothetical protein